MGWPRRFVNYFSFFFINGIKRFCTLKIATRACGNCQQNTSRSRVLPRASYTLNLGVESSSTLPRFSVQAPTATKLRIDIGQQ